jgi:hypothetical protein
VLGRYFRDAIGRRILAHGHLTIRTDISDYLEVKRCLQARFTVVDYSDPYCTRKRSFAKRTLYIIRHQPCQRLSA